AVPAWGLYHHRYRYDGNGLAPVSFWPAICRAGSAAGVCLLRPTGHAHPGGDRPGEPDAVYAGGRAAVPAVWPVQPDDRRQPDAHAPCAAFNLFAGAAFGRFWATAAAAYICQSRGRRRGHGPDRVVFAALCGANDRHQRFNPRDAAGGGAGEPEYRVVSGAGGAVQNRGAALVGAAPAETFLSRKRGNGLKLIVLPDVSSRGIGHPSPRRRSW